MFQTCLQSRFVVKPNKRIFSFCRKPPRYIGDFKFQSQESRKAAKLKRVQNDRNFHIMRVISRWKHHGHRGVSTSI